MKARNRKERIEFLIRKQGSVFTQSLLSASDRYVKKYYEAIYPLIKDKEDKDSSYEQVSCDRCGCEVIWHSECGCGHDRAVFDKEGWLDDIEGNDNRVEGDEEFLKNIQ